MKKIVKVFAVITASMAFLSSCGSTGNTESKSTFNQEKFNAAYSAGDMDTCIGMLESRGSDKILTELDSSMLQYIKKDYPTSAREFVQTQQDMQQVTKDMTVGKVMEAALVGENSIEYAGAVYERLLAYSMKTANALKMGRVDQAVGVFNEYTGNYKDEIAAIVQQQKEVEQKSAAASKNEDVTKALDVMKGQGFNVDLSKFTAPAASSEVYDTSAFLSYLGTVVYAANGDSAHAKDFASVLKTQNSAIDVSEDISIPSGKGRLNVIALTDTIGKKSQAGELVQVASVGNVILNFKVVYPEFKAQSHAISVNKVSLSNGDSKSFTLIEDFDKAVAMDCASKANGAFNRSLFRNITKNSAAVAAGYASLAKAEEAVKKASNPIAVKAAEKAYEKAVVGVNTSLTAVVDAEKADVRQGSFFPNKASAAGFTLNAGTYTVTVEYSNGKKDVIEGVIVEAGKPTVIVSECMN